jgi:hypothetical protein
MNKKETTNMKKLSFTLIGYSLLLIIAFFAGSGCDQWNYLSTIAIILTGVILIWYTWETHLLRVEAHRQNEIQLCPFVIVVPKQKQFQLRNIGNGPALNVSIKDVEIDKDFDVRIHFPDHVPFLTKDGATDISAEGYKKGKPAGDFFNAHLYPEYSNRTLRLIIEFQNVDSQTYIVEETVSPGKMTIDGIKSNKKITNHKTL